MPSLTGYVRFKAPAGQWCALGFGPIWGYPRKDLVAIEQSPDGSTYIFTYVNGVQSVSRGYKLEKGKPYPFSLSYSGGVAGGSIAGKDLGTLPAPTVDLPVLLHPAVDYYPNWWDVPEYRGAAIFTPLPIAVGVGLIKFIK